MSFIGIKRNRNEIKVTVDHYGNFVKIVFKDNGSRIPTEDLDRISKLCVTKSSKSRIMANHFRSLAVFCTNREMQGT